MLVLSRKVNEQILIGDDIKITLVRVQGGKVRVGIEAPRDLRVIRGELDAHQAPASAHPPKQLNRLDQATGAGQTAQTETDWDDSVEIDPLAEVFANPQPEAHTHRLRPTDSSKRKTATASSAIRQAATQTPSTLGNVVPHNRLATGHRAPLSGFVSAS